MRILSIKKLDRYGRTAGSETENAEETTALDPPLWRDFSGGRGKSAVRVLVTPEEGEPFVISGKHAARLGLVEGLELSPELQKEILETLRALCMQRCGTLLGGRDYPVQRLRTKLMDAGFPPSIVEECIKKLSDAHYLDDRRYAQNYVRVHIQDRSLLRIRQDLADRGISETCIDEVFAEISEETEPEEAQLARIRRLLEKRGYDHAQADFAQRQKTMAFLHRKGYESALIRRAMAEQDTGGVC